MSMTTGEAPTLRQWTRITLPANGAQIQEALRAAGQQWLSTHPGRIMKPGFFQGDKWIEPVPYPPGTVDYEQVMVQQVGNVLEFFCDTAMDSPEETS